MGDEEDGNDEPEVGGKYSGADKVGGWYSGADKVGGWYGGADEVGGWYGRAGEVGGWYGKVEEESCRRGKRWSREERWMRGVKSWWMQGIGCLGQM